MRCTPPDLKQFENLLNQIDLIDGISGAEKVKALSEIGLEVTLNSVEGTRLLVEQLILVIAGWDEHPQIAKLISPQDAEALLDLVAANLWDWGVQSVEYQRKPEPVKICADSLYAILKIARKLQFKKAMNTCISGIDAMYQAAVRDRLDGLVALVGKSRTSLFKEVTSKPRVELKKQLDMIKKSIYANNLINNIGSRLWALKDFFLENDELLSIESNRVFYEKYLRDLSELERRPALNLAWHERYNEMLAALNDVGA